MRGANRKAPGSEREQFHALQNSLAALQLWTHELSMTGACPNCEGRQRRSIEAIARLVDESINLSAALDSVVASSVTTKDPSSAPRAGRGARRTK